MGKQANTAKDRVCWTCRETFNVTARELKRHAVWCVEAKNISDRLNAIGIINPNLELRGGN